VLISTPVFFIVFLKHHKHGKKHAENMLANMLRDGRSVNWCHRLAFKPTPANQGE
jgi:hypothetical protein